MLLTDEVPLISTDNENNILLNESHKYHAPNKEKSKTKYMFLVSVMVMRAMETLMISMTMLQSFTGEPSKDLIVNAYANGVRSLAMIIGLESCQTMLHYCGARITVFMGGCSLLGYAFCLYLENSLTNGRVTASSLLLLFAFLQGATSHFMEEGLYAYYGGNKAFTDESSVLMEDINKQRYKLKSFVKLA